MQAGFDQLTHILLAEKAQTSKKRPAISDSDEMCDSEEIQSSQAKRSRVMHQSIETPTLWVPGKGRGFDIDPGQKASVSLEFRSYAPTLR